MCTCCLQDCIQDFSCFRAVGGGGGGGGGVCLLKVLAVDLNTSPSCHPHPALLCMITLGKSWERSLNYFKVVILFMCGNHCRPTSAT